MKKVRLLFDKRFTHMTDGEQIFDECVVTAMNSIQLWDYMMISYKVNLIKILHKVKCCTKKN